MRATAELRSITNAYWKAAAPFDGHRQIRFANAFLINAVTRGGGAIYFDIDVGRAADLFGINILGAGHIANDIGCSTRQILERFQIISENLDANLRANAGREHVDTVLDWLRPDICDARQAQLLVHLSDQRFTRQSRAPLFCWLQVDYGLVHVYRRGIG